MYYLLLCIVLNVRNGLAFNSSKQIEGYPEGFLSDCPGSTRDALITTKSLKYLTLSAVSGRGLSTVQKKYNYYQMTELAKDPALDFKKKTLLYVGGFLDSPSLPLAWFMGNVYRNIGYNVLLLDTNMFTTVEYPRAARFMRTAGKHVAEMIAELSKLGLNPKKTEIIGLSLGGQTASFVAKNFYQLTGTKVSRLTGLDPAGPCFRNLGPDERIDKNDADFVEVISTNIDNMGMAAPVGHVNYYVNGGENQPGDVYWLFCNSLCSHIRSHTLWLTALTHRKSFIAIQCDSVQQARNRQCYGRKPLITNFMGLSANKSIEGIFYLATTNRYPYYLSTKGLKKENDYILSLTKSFNEEDVIKI